MFNFDKIKETYNKETKNTQITSVDQSEDNSEDGSVEILDILLYMVAVIFAFFIYIGDTGDDPPTFRIIPFLISLSCASFATVRIILHKRKEQKTNEIASLVVSSNLRSIPDIARFSKMEEDKVIKILRMLVSGSNNVKLGNDAKYLKGATINLQTLEIILSDKYIEKEPWACSYCRAVNTPENLVCQTCKAPKKKS